jgi:hypothetical protein
MSEPPPEVRGAARFWRGLILVKIALIAIVAALVMRQLG